MTDKVNPSPQRTTLAYATATAIAESGGGSDGWIVPSSEPTDVSTDDADIDETALNGFDETSSTTSFDVTIDAGEAFVYGSWLVTESSNTVTLDSSTAGQVVSVGWDSSLADTVLVDLQSNLSGNPSIPLWEFDTDSNGVTDVRDVRQLGPRYWETVSTSSNYEANSYENIVADTSSEAVTVTLPPATSELIVTVKMIGGANTLTIATPGTETIDGDASRTITSEYNALTIVSDGSNYFII